MLVESGLEKWEIQLGRGCARTQYAHQVLKRNIPRQFVPKSMYHAD